MYSYFGKTSLPYDPMLFFYEALVITGLGNHLITRPLAKMKALLRSYQQRGLSLKGRALVAKTQGLTQLMYLSQTLTVPDWVHKEANTAIYNFIWKGPDKVTRKANISDDERSLKITDTRTMNALHLVQNLGLLSSGARWVQFLRRDFNIINEDMNKSKNKFKSREGQLPFITDLIRSCQAIQAEYSSSDVRENSTLEANNIFRDYRLKPLEFPRLRRKGYIRLEQVIKEGIIPNHGQVELTYLEKLEWTKLTRYVNPIIQRSNLTITGTSSNPTDLVIMIGSSKLINGGITYRGITQLIRHDRSFPHPPAWTKGTVHAQNDSNWLNKSRYKLWGCNSKFLDFCHRWLAGLLFARKQLHRFGIKDSPVCHMCGEDPQTVEHLFWYCPEINKIKEELVRNWNIDDQVLNPTRENFLPHLTARLFHCIYLENIQAPVITAPKVLSRFYHYLDLEKVIMDKNGKMNSFLELWIDFHRPA
jgi:hypothetical protein